ncbi:MAG: hypothetical protein K5798_06385 [Nitrosopumilus sp.]|nr:hypothetical protein [Nitrosopumilus sp.]
MLGDNTKKLFGDLRMGKYCENCGKYMKISELTHCSDECLLSGIKDSTSLSENGFNALSWDEKSDPWT